MEHVRYGDINWKLCAWYCHQRIGNGTGGLGNKRTRGDHPNDSIKIGQKPEKSQRDLRIFAVTQTNAGVKNSRRCNNNNNNNNENNYIFAIRVDHRLKIKENVKIDKYLKLARELKTTMEHEGDSDTSYNWNAWNNTRKIGQGTIRLGNKRIIRDHPYNCIFKNRTEY